MRNRQVEWLTLGSLLGLAASCSSNPNQSNQSLFADNAGASGSVLSATPSGGRSSPNSGGATNGGGSLASNGGSNNGGTTPSNGGATSNAGSSGDTAPSNGGAAQAGASSSAAGATGSAGAVGGGSGGASGQFPLTVSSNGRYLQDATGKPFRIHGDAIWDASVSFSLTDLRTYLDDREARGFNTILVQISDPVKYVPESPAPASKGAGGALPFLKNVSGGTWNGDPTFASDNNAHNPAPGNFDADFSSPNPTYFAWIDTLLNEAAARGFLVVLTPCYLGYNNGAQDGWWRTLNNSVNTQAVSLGFGQYLGNRYKGFGNILWEMGVDMMPPAGSEGEARAHKILEGIRAAGDTHLWTGHWKAGYLSTDEAAFASAMTVEGVYTHGPYPTTGPTYGRSRLGYSHEPHLPTVLLETNYEGSYGATSAQIREFMWDADLSTIGGAIFGNSALWAVPNDWQSSLDSQGARDMQRLGGLLDSLPWYQLVPSGLAATKSLIVAGGGTYTTLANPGDTEQGGEGWVTSASTPDGRHFVAYIPDSHTGSVTLDLTLLSGTGHARWFDPTNGTFTEIGLYPNSASMAFSVPGTNSAGANDWLLVIDVP